MTYTGQQLWSERDGCAGHTLLSAQASLMVSAHPNPCEFANFGWSKPRLWFSTTLCEFNFLRADSDDLHGS